MTVKELCKNSSGLDAYKTRRIRKSDGYLLEVYDQATNEVKHSFCFDTEKECTIADCNIWNSIVAEALINKRAEYCMIIKTSENTSQKTGYWRWAIHNQ